MMDAPADEEEDANVLQAPTGANQSEGRGGSQSLSDKRMKGLGAMDGSWMRGIETVPV
jgi:hypothetical protein